MQEIQSFREWLSAPVRNFIPSGFDNNHKPEGNSPQVLGAGCGAIPNIR
jgi:hypothetical protein